MLQQYLGQFPISSTVNGLTVDGTAIQVPYGNYYIAGYTSETTNQLCEEITEQIQTNVATQATATVTYSGSTGKVTITLDASATIEFTDTGLATILGFASTLSGASSYVGTSQPRYVWRPTLPPSYFPTNLNNFWNKRSTSRVQRSASGTTYGAVGNLLYDARITYENLPEADIITPATGTIYQDLETFFEDVIHATKPIRIYPDRTLNTSSDFETGIFGAEDLEEIGSFEDYKNRSVSDYNGLWGCELLFLKYIEAS